MRDAETPIERPVRGEEVLVESELSPTEIQRLQRIALQAEYHRYSMPHVGIDGCPAGWVFVGIGDDDGFRFGVLGRFAQVSSLLRRAELILVDMPIGLPSEAFPSRECDRLARRAITPHGSSVFPVPARPALAMAGYPEANAENRRCLGLGLSRQSWGLAPKLRDVDAFMRRRRTDAIREIHPEVAFWALNGGEAVAHKKKTRQGLEERLVVLERHYGCARECFDVARRAFLKKDVGDDDLVDAMVGAVTARLNPRLATFPEKPPLDEEGLPMEIVYALDTLGGG